MIGIDSVEIRRIARTMGKSFFEKIFTENELSHLEHVRFAPQTVAGMFAVKEAVSKRSGPGYLQGFPGETSRYYTIQPELLIPNCIIKRLRYCL